MKNRKKLEIYLKNGEKEILLLPIKRKNKYILLDYGEKL